MSAVGARVHDCVGALLVRDGKVLLGRRAADRAWLPGAWDLFGGHVEPGETPEEALRRELAEELGIHAPALQPLGCLEAEDGTWTLRVFAVTQWTGEPVNRQPREHAHIQWMTPGDARERLAAAHPGLAALIV